MQKDMAIQSKKAKKDLLARTVRQLFLITTSTSDPCDSVAFTTRHPILHALQGRKKKAATEKSMGDRWHLVRRRALSAARMIVFRQKPAVGPFRYKYKKTTVPRE